MNVDFVVYILDCMVLMVLFIVFEMPVFKNIVTLICHKLSRFACSVCQFNTGLV